MRSPPSPEATRPGRMAGAALFVLGIAFLYLGTVLVFAGEPAGNLLDAIFQVVVVLAVFYLPSSPLLFVGTRVYRGRYGIAHAFVAGLWGAVLYFFTYTLIEPSGTHSVPPVEVGFPPVGMAILIAAATWVVFVLGVADGIAAKLRHSVDGPTRTRDRLPVEGIVARVWRLAWWPVTAEGLVAIVPVALLVGIDSAVGDPVAGGVLPVGLAAVVVGCWWYTNRRIDRVDVAVKDFLADRWDDFGDPGTHVLVEERGAGLPISPDRWRISTRVVVDDETLTVGESVWFDRRSLLAYPDGETTTVDRDRIDTVAYLDGVLAIGSDEGTIEVRVRDRPDDLIAAIDPAGREDDHLELEGVERTRWSGPPLRAATRRDLLLGGGGVLGALTVGMAVGEVTPVPELNRHTSPPSTNVGFDYSDGRVEITHTGGESITRENTDTFEECADPALSIRVGGDHRVCWPTPVEEGDSITVETGPDSNVQVLWADPGGGVMVLASFTSEG